jgi:hypothetical protein
MEISMYIVVIGLFGLVVRVSGYRSKGPGFDTRPYQIFWEVGGSGTGSTQPFEELLEWKSSGYPQKLALISPTSGGRSVGIIRLRAKATELVFFFRL